MEERREDGLKAVEKLFGSHLKTALESALKSYDENIGDDETVFPEELSE